MYRIAATLLATFRRWWTPAASFGTTDPINSVLALLAKHWDPSINRAAWSRQIAFFLSGGMLLASWNIGGTGDWEDDIGNEVDFEAGKRMS